MQRLPIERGAPFTVISGGQTGADRGALRAAISCAAACGGWCPAGRLAEDGVIPEFFPVTELPGAGYQDRTAKNVADSDGTVVFFFAKLSGGSLLTRRRAEAQSKPLLLIDAAGSSIKDAASTVVGFISEHRIRVLNIAGPRASGWADAETWVRDVVTQVLQGLDLP